MPETCADGHDIRTIGRYTALHCVFCRRWALEYPEEVAARDPRGRS